MNSPSAVSPYQPNPLLRAAYSRLFRRIRVDASWGEHLRGISEQGPVVYVLRSMNAVDFLALDYFTRELGLPEIRFANDLGPWVFAPMARQWFRAGARGPGERMSEALSGGGSAVLFLKRPPGVLDVASGASRGRGMREGDELVQALVRVQRSQSRPLLLVPQLFVWTKRPDTRGTELMDVVFGPREWASSVRTAAQLLSNYRSVRLRAGAPINLQEFLSSSPEVSDANLTRKLTYTMLRRLERERRVATGPSKKPPERVRREIVSGPRFLTDLRRLRRTGKTEPELLERSVSLLSTMQAAPDHTVHQLMAVGLNKLFSRVYSGIDVDSEGLERLREAASESTLVLLPSHKSHVDYLVLSYAFHLAGLPLPLIAAGDNLSFFPLGILFRRAGAFFIRRSFRGDHLYPVVVEAYIRRIIRDGHTVEMFLEGGRSRTGKLLAPKFGLLKMLVGAALAVPGRQVLFVPVSIGYERVIDSYQTELEGGDKQQEDAAGLLGATGVLRSRYGRINLQIGRLLTLDEVRRDLGIAEGPLGPAKQRALVTRLGNRVMDEINRVTAVTPGALTALALLTYHRRGQTHAKLLLRCERLLSTLTRMGARTSPALLGPSGELRPEAIREAVQLFADGELVEVHYVADATPKRRPKPRAGQGAIYTVVEDKRLQLDGSKNIIVHFFLERALMATALPLGTNGAAAPELVKERGHELSQWLKHEFRFRAQGDFRSNFETTVETMVEDGDIARHADGSLAPGPGRDDWTGRQWLMLYTSLLRNFLESYRIAARGLLGLLEGPLPEKELRKSLLSTGKRMYLSGEVERREAVSSPVLLNALASFQDLRIISQSKGETTLTEAFATDNDLLRLEQSIAKYLERDNSP